MNNNIRIQRSKRFLSQALSLWADIGYDSQYGGYVEALDFAARPLYYLDKRFRIHPRNIFSHVAGTLWGYFEGLSTAKCAFDHITQHCWLPSGGFATLSGRTGTILDASVKTYDHAFVLLAFGWLYYATRNPIHKEWLYNTWDFMNTTLRHADGGFITGISPNGIPIHKEKSFHGPIRLQNPHMHTLEAMLNLIELFDEPIWKEEAQNLYYLFTTYFARESEGKLREYFNEKWKVDKKSGHSLEPGHHYEWVWILQKYESIMNISVSMIEPLYTFATTCGTNEAGFGYDEVHFDGTPIRNTHRMWIHTEILKAHIAMYKRSKNLEYIQRANNTVDTLFTYYLIPEYGVWYDQLDDNLQNISTNSPSSTLYHLLIALNEYIQCIESIS